MKDSLAREKGGAANPRRRNRKVFKRREAIGGFAPSPGDLAAVEDVGQYHILLARQLLTLHWPGQGQRRHGESRLRELYHQAWLDRVPLFDGFGPPRALYVLGKLGRSHCAGKLGIPAAEFGLRPVRERGHDILFLRHHLFSVDCLIALRCACEAEGGGILYFEDERTLRAAHRRNSEALPTIPDAFVVLNVGGQVQSFCLEADRGTVDREAWARKVERYLQWSRDAAYREVYHRPAVLTVVDSEACQAERRVLELKAWTEKVIPGGRDASLFWFAASEAATNSAILRAPVWRVAGFTEPMTLMNGGT